MSCIPRARRGRIMGRFCTRCGSVFSLFGERHQGKPLHGKDHVGVPCSHEGERFTAGQSWWEEAVEVLPPPPEAEEPAPV